MKQYPSPGSVYRADFAARTEGPRRGFSLVEVTLALGIIAFGLLAVLGLMPVGLTTMRIAMDEMTEAQILQKVSAEAALMPYARLDEFSARTQYFNGEGTEQSAADENTKFVVRLARTAASFPGADSSAELPDHIAAFRVEIARSRSPDATPPSKSVLYLANSGN